MYDLNDDGYISREEMFQMLKNTMPKQLTEEDPDEGIKEIVEGMVKRMVRQRLTIVSTLSHYPHSLPFRSNIPNSFSLVSFPH